MRARRVDTEATALEMVQEDSEDPAGDWGGVAMIIPSAPLGMKTYTRLTYVHAFRIALDENGIWCQPFPLPIQVRAMTDYGLNPANRRIEKFTSYWLSNGRAQESWRLKDGDWVLIDAVDPTNAIVLSPDQFAQEFTLHEEKVLTEGGKGSTLDSQNQQHYCPYCNAKSEFGEPLVHARYCAKK